MFSVGAYIKGFGPCSWTATSWMMPLGPGSPNTRTGLLLKQAMDCPANAFESEVHYLCPGSSKQTFVPSIRALHAVWLTLT